MFVTLLVFQPAKLWLKTEHPWNTDTAEYVGTVRKYCNGEVTRTHINRTHFCDTPNIEV
jgi:hypothetical protein